MTRGAARVGAYLVLLTLLVAAGAGAKKDKAASSKLAELEQLRSLSWESKDGLIFIDNVRKIEPLLKGSERPYSVVISVRLVDDMLKNEGVKTQKHAKAIEESMKSAIKLYRGAVAKDQEELFFISLEFNENTQKLFQKMEIQSFPTTVLVPKKHQISMNDPTFKLGQQFRFTQSNQKEFYEFLEESFGLGVFESKDEKINVSVFNIVFGYGVIILMARMLWFFSQKGLLVPMMAIGSIVVFWVSTSGLIKCIIHNLPMVVSDRNGNPQVFIADNRQQTITEGVVMSSAYLVIAFAMSAFTYVGKTFVESTFKSVFLWASFIIGVMTYAFVIDCFQWKTHMSTMIYGFNL
ncbi:subunit OST3/OST6 of oligosaccharyl transferase complex [Chloropicon primus]|uniref:Subunit OST3/OST6 of oligosaccharyl transferase complex n=2 Tax=Chloropicon primus TaxID=1764295 RepID=A0A5B8MDV3_9CHLO|nr:subunit OST3/OST6 of oligosaccharyl transferase complex [Chloropicon primus]|eukprot:QDZ17530.1 subunit OST3/OST6 of oligosaccharyl transferase complex [Chloropicon primus]